MSFLSGVSNRKPKVSEEKRAYEDLVCEQDEAQEKKTKFRVYRNNTTIEQFYAENHTKQTLDFVLSQKLKYEKLQRGLMGVWDAMEMLNQLKDDSDPDTTLSQIEHCLQVAEAARKDNLPRWFQVTCLIHDLGKILSLYGEPQWTSVGDTFPVGCKFSKKIVYSRYFEGNPDSKNPQLNTKFGIYHKKCGLHRVHMSYGHDEYLYHVVKNYLPEEASFIIRYHSFYAAHKEGAYRYLMTKKDEELMSYVQLFNPYDLYTKSDNPPDIESLKPYYQQLISEYFPSQISW